MMSCAWVVVQPEVIRIIRHAARGLESATGRQKPGGASRGMAKFIDTAAEHNPWKLVKE